MRVLALSTAALLTGCYAHGHHHSRVYATVPPPAAHVEVVATSPGADVVWVPGYWHWDGVAYVWIPGAYVAARPGYVWVAPRYVYRGGTYVYVRGYWGPHYHHRAHHGYYSGHHHHRTYQRSHVRPHHRRHHRRHR